MPSVEEVEGARARFWQEQARFDAELPRLMNDPQLLGRWVVFLDGAVKHTANTREEAHQWAVHNVDRFSGFVVGEVAVPRVHRIGGARRTP